MKPSCQSLTSQLVKVVGNFVEEYQEFRKDAAKVIVDAVVPGQSSQALNNLIDGAIDLQTSLFKAYGVAVGEGKGKIGARHLIIPTKKVTGNLLTERTFIVAPSPFDKVTITIKKTGGKAGADIAACAKYADGKQHYDEKIKSIDKGKNSTGDSVTFKFTGMADKLLTIHLVQTGVITNKCQYSLSIEGEFDNATLQALNSGGKKKTLVRA